MGREGRYTHALEGRGGNGGDNDIAGRGWEPHSEHKRGDHAENHGKPQHPPGKGHDIHGDDLTQTRHSHGTHDKAHNCAGDGYRSGTSRPFVQGADHVGKIHPCRFSEG